MGITESNRYLQSLPSRMRAGGGGKGPWLSKLLMRAHYIPDTGDKTTEKDTVSALKEFPIQWERQTSMQIMAHKEKHTLGKLGTLEPHTTSEEEIPRGLCSQRTKCCKNRTQGCGEEKGVRSVWENKGSR